MLSPAQEPRVKPIVWRAFATTASIGAAVAARNVATSLWQRRTGHEPPSNPADPTTTWTEALAWTAATGVLIGVARLAARRGAAALWQQVDGDLPPGLEDVA
jgi:hypothetical protein